MVNKKRKSGRRDFILIVLAVLFLTAIGSISYFFPSPESKFLKPETISRQKPEPIGRVVATIDFGNGTKRVFEGEIVENESLVDVFILIAKAGNFYYKFDEKANLAAVETFVKTENRFWRWYINGKQISVPPHKVLLKEGDRILIKYESR